MKKIKKTVVNFQLLQIIPAATASFRPFLKTYKFLKLNASLEAIPDLHTAVTVINPHTAAIT